MKKKTKAKPKTKAKKTPTLNLVETSPDDCLDPEKDGAQAQKSRFMKGTSGDYDYILVGTKGNLAVGFKAFLEKAHHPIDPNITASIIGLRVRAALDPKVSDGAISGTAIMKTIPLAWEKVDNTRASFVIHALKENAEHIAFIEACLNTPDEDHNYFKAVERAYNSVAEHCEMELTWDECHALIREVVENDLKVYKSSLGIGAADNVVALDQQGDGENKGPTVH